MLNITDIKVYTQFSNEFFVLEWVISPTTEDLIDYRFSVLMSTNSSGPYTLLADNLEDFSIIIRNLHHYKSNVRYYFKVGIENVKTGESVLSTSFGTLVKGEDDGITDTIIFNSTFLLEEIIKNKVLLLSRKLTGQRCPECWDPITKSTKKSTCLSCYNVGFTGGYYSPIEINISVDPATESLRVSANDIRPGRDPTSAWTLNFPIIKPGDVLVDNYGTRYIVINVRPTVRGRYVLRQVMAIQEIPSTDIIYKLEV